MITKPYRIKAKSVQKRYYDKNPFDEYELWPDGTEIPRDEVHEIEHGSNKTYEEWNMICLTSKNHIEAHTYKLKKDTLFAVKIIYGSQLPPMEFISRNQLDNRIKTTWRLNQKQFCGDCKKLKADFCYLYKAKLYPYAGNLVCLKSCAVEL